MNQLYENVDLPEGWSVEQVGDHGVHLWNDKEGNSLDLLCYDLVGGITLLDIDLDCPTLPSFNPPDVSFYTINWCERGRCETDIDDEGTVVVGESSLCVSSAIANTHSYPTSQYSGFELVVKPTAIDADGWALLRSLGLTRENLCPVAQRKTLTVRPQGELLAAVEAVSAELDRDVSRTPHLLLDACRLLMLVAETDLEGSLISGTYLQRSQRDMARAIFSKITADSKPSVDLLPLSREFGVSEASLRTYFAKVYGATPAAFARSHAMRVAAERLCAEDTPVSEIALGCGYSNPSKFAAAFKREMGTAPLEFRRRAHMGI